MLCYKNRKKNEHTETRQNTIIKFKTLKYGHYANEG
jgi:hypothetical protein